MQAKGLIKFFAIAIILVCLYQLLFTVAAYRADRQADRFARERVLGDPNALPAEVFQGDATERALFVDSVNRLITSVRRNYQDSIASETVLNLGIVSFDYRTAKARQLSLGLDLQGGMSVVLQVSLEELIVALSGDSKDETFLRAIELARERQVGSQEDFIALFGNAFEELDPGARLAAIFARPEYKDLIDFNSSNQDVLNFLRTESNDAVNRTYSIISTRIDRFGVTQPNIFLQQATNRIIVELPGVEDPAQVRQLLQSTAKLEFWETFENTEVVGFLAEANTILAGIVGAEDSLHIIDRAPDLDFLLKDREETLTPSDDTTADAIDELSPSTEPLISSSDTTPTDDLLGTTATDSPATDDLLSGTAETDSLADEAAFRQENPLFYILNPSIFQDPQTGQQQYAPGPVVGYSYARDMDRVMDYLTRDRVRAVFPRNLKFIWGAKSVREDREVFALYAIKTRIQDDKASLEGDVIVDARQDFDQQGRPDIDMTMNAEGARKWKAMTGENLDKSIAIVLDNRVYSAPTVQSEISGGRSQITGQFEIEEAQLLANILKAGKLPAPARIIEEEVVGPTLGKESINAGLLSLAFGLLLVLIFMVFYYSSAGIISDLMLLLNLFFIMGVLASFGAALTLPGMAGIVLTIGMAVDANVIIFERIREELARGKGMKLAIADGYRNSYSAIVDANITTLITGFILLFFGLGPVKGFATVLVIGIFSSLFTAVLISRLAIDWYTSSDRKINFHTNITKNAFANLNYDFVSKRKIAYVFSAVVIVAGLISFATKGFELGVDFKGGRTYVVRFDHQVNTTEISSALATQFGQNPQVKTFGTANQVKITTSYLIDSPDEDADRTVEQGLYEGLAGLYTDRPDSFDEFHSNYVMSSMKVGPTIAEDIKNGAVMATIFALLGIFLYILVRFRKWQFSLGAIIALAHDVLIVLAVFSIFSGILPFSLEIDQAFIAAILTIIGYSINDTVVVFDRVREYLGLHQTKDIKSTINLAINHTMSRTIITALTTLFVVLILTFFGGDVIRGFSFALLIGIVVGTYSSVFIATPIVVDLLKDDRPKFAATTTTPTSTNARKAPVK